MPRPAIRLADESDLDEILALDRACFPADEKPLVDATWWVAEEPSGLAGYASAYESTWWPACLYLSRVGVAPHARGQGLSEALVRAAMRHARRCGAVGMVTDTTSAAMGNALIRLGWRLFHTAGWALPSSMYFRWRAIPSTP